MLALPPLSPLPGVQTVTFGSLETLLAILNGIQREREVAEDVLHCMVDTSKRPLTITGLGQLEARPTDRISQPAGQCPGPRHKKR